MSHVTSEHSHAHTTTSLLSPSSHHHRRLCAVFSHVSPSSGVTRAVTADVIHTAIGNAVFEQTNNSDDCQLPHDMIDLRSSTTSARTARRRLEQRTTCVCVCVWPRMEINLEFPLTPRARVDDDKDDGAVLWLKATHSRRAPNAPKLHPLFMYPSRVCDVCDTRHNPHTHRHTQIWQPELPAC